MIFVDSWAWIALALKLDQHHRSAKAQHQSFRRSKRRYVTTNFVLGETISRLYRLLAAAQVESYVQSLLTASDKGEYLLIHVSATQFQRAWTMRQKYHDKPDISFVDFTSMVVMQDLGITDVFTGDAHFRQVGLGFQLFP